MKKILLRFAFAAFFFAIGAAAAAYCLVRQPDSRAAGMLERLVTCPCCTDCPQQRCSAKADEPQAATAAKSAESGPVAKAEPEKPVEPWQGLAAENWRFGAKLNARAFKDRVSLFYVWNAEDKNSMLTLPRMEELWQGFRSKQLVVVGSHRGELAADKVVAAAKSAGVTFPVYADARYFKEPASAATVLPYLYVVNHEGRVVYGGRSERAATEVLVDALVNAELFRNAKK